jgi:site-specific recombinase XerD
VDVRPYGLRHFFATEAIRNGVPLKTLSEIIGHANTRMTEFYCHLSGDTEHLVDGVEQANHPKPRKGD